MNNAILYNYLTLNKEFFLYDYVRYKIVKCTALNSQTLNPDGITNQMTEITLVLAVVIVVIDLLPKNYINQNEDEHCRKYFLL